MRIVRPILAVVVAASALAGCGVDPSAGESGGAGGPWSFTDGSGEVIELDQTPARIIAHAGEAAALISFGIRPVGIYADGPIESDANLRELDLSGIEILGEEWGKIDVERAAELAPDLIVADWWPADQAHSGFEEGVEEASLRLADLAPVVGASQGESIVDLAEGYERLAESLGADVDAPEIAANRERFEAAVARFQEAAAAKPGLTVAAMSPYEDLLYVANPEYAPELLDFQRWGLDVLNPERPDADFPYWETLSWENADKYQPDLILWDDRTYTPTSNEELLESQPTWSSLAAAEAGAVVAWPAYWLHTFGAYADELEELSTAIEAADENIGD